jgi:hypothetical protein
MAGIISEGYKNHQKIIKLDKYQKFRTGITQNS